ncbi:hypothetical protein F5876DRAFT_51256 [Lentinula aff. lateritia]|uniref:Uncharacterized protein n=1 Tax=Lentinula aff. lateritia TaxID=2804960 RepID=A0ACC1TMF4_9AGAR|nr:hypothetical protein F5876DRAFT_51256 [Lentinula aff. lateritia]
MASPSRDHVHYFFAEAHVLTSEAKFVINALPNAEMRAVESLVHKLYAVPSILRDIDDTSSNPDELEHLGDYRLWRDIRKDTLEAYQKIFKYLEDNELLDMSDNIQRLCLYVVFHPRIQQSLRRTADAWNHHQIRTAGHKTPIALYELSREHAKTRGYWTGDPGDNVETASHPSYGLEDELEQGAPGDHQVSEEDGDDIRVNENEDITDVHSILTGMGFDIEQEDGNWGIEVYCEAVLKLKVYVEAQL